MSDRERMRKMTTHHSHLLFFPFTHFSTLKKTIAFPSCIVCTLTSSSDSHFSAMMQSLRNMTHVSPQSPHAGRKADLCRHHDDAMGLLHSMILMMMNLLVTDQH